MTVTQAVIKRMDEIMAEKKMTRSQLCSASGLSTGTVSSIYKQLSRGVTLNTLSTICKGLGVTMSEFLDTPYFNNLDGTNV
ncbi:MAG: helix-turn-helix transcriptional regulator [Clostridia bacterium]|nr:helix-turn-helix transcriptional regulator [Clostridia bacterium]